jgi:hypothetical protein
MSNASNSSSSIPVLNQQIPLPQFAFFQLVKVKLTGEVALIVGMKYGSSGEQSEALSTTWADPLCVDLVEV